MKSISLDEAKQKLRHYGKVCRKEEVVVTVNGKPAFELVPYLGDDDDFISDLIETNAKFRALLDKRRGEPTMTTAELRKRLDKHYRNAERNRKRSQ